MMLESILRSFSEEIKEKYSALSLNLSQSLNFMESEQSLSNLMNKLSALLLELLLDELLSSPCFLKALKQVYAKMGMRFKEYRKLKLRLYNGCEIKVSSPYFIKAASKKKVKKVKRYRGKATSGHMGVSLLGFMKGCSLSLVNKAVKLATLCPSFEITRQVFKEDQIRVDEKVIRQLCQDLGGIGLENRGSISLNGQENLCGYSLLIGIDGGRLRERRKKKGRKKKGQKRHGFYTDWREPKLFTMYLLDDQGNKVKNFSPLYDATMGDHKETFALLERYLKELDLQSLRRIIICGDGAGWIWNNFGELKEKLKGFGKPIIEVIDWAHARQNLQEIIDLLPRDAKNYTKLIQQCKDLLYKGNISEIYQWIDKHIKGKPKITAQKKWCNYFYSNKERMCYESFKSNAIPCGSGCVESAIRRVINMRLKSAGTFWIKENAEYLLFLRSQVLSGRWTIFIENVRKNALKSMMEIHKQQTAVTLPQAA